VNAFERRVRAAVYATLRDEASAPSVARLAADLGAPREDVDAVLTERPVAGFEVLPALSPGHSRWPGTQ
jgi:hypothetical protein